MRSAADELFERWKELYEYLEVLAAELNVGRIYVSGDHDGTASIAAVVPAAHAQVFAMAHIVTLHRMLGTLTSGSMSTVLARTMSHK